MTRESVMAMPTEKVKAEVATLRGIRKMRPTEIAQRYGCTIEEAGLASERWIWEGKERDVPEEMLDIAVESEDDNGATRLISFDCPDYTSNIAAAWPLWRKLPKPKEIAYCRADGRWWACLSWGKATDPDDEYADWVQAPSDIEDAEIIARAFVLFMEGQ